MTLQINTFDDLLEIINTHPEWRRKLVKALFPEVDLPKALQELIESNQQMRIQLGDIDARLVRMEAWQVHADDRFDRIETWQSKADERFNRIEDWQAKADERFKQIDERFDRVDERFDRVDERFDRMEDRQTRMEDRQTRMEGQQTRMEDRQTRMEDRQTRMEGQQTRMERDIATLKGHGYETEFVRKADAVFGLFIRRGHDARQEIANLLESAEEAGQLSATEYEQVFASDLLWAGRLKGTTNDIYLIVELSWLAEEYDIERSSLRAQILNRIGISAVPVVAAKLWPDGLRTVALAHGIAVVDDLRADRDAWANLLSISA